MPTGIDTIRVEDLNGPVTISVDDDGNIISVIQVSDGTSSVGDGGNAVHYTPQTPTDPEKEIARTNIGLGTTDRPVFAGSTLSDICDDYGTVPLIALHPTNPTCDAVTTRLGVGISDVDDLHNTFTLAMNAPLRKNGISVDPGTYDDPLRTAIVQHWEFNWSSLQIGGGFQYVDIAVDGVTVTSSVAGQIPFNKDCKALDSVKIGTKVRPVLSADSTTVILAVPHPDAPATLIWNFGLQTASGTATIAANSTSVVGTGTKFTEEFVVGGCITIQDVTVGPCTRVIASITNNLLLVTEREMTFDVSGQVKTPGIRTNELFWKHSLQPVFFFTGRTLDQSSGQSIIYFPLQVDRQTGNRDTTTPVIWGSGNSVKALDGDPLIIRAENTYAGGVTAGVGFDIINRGTVAGSNGCDGWWRFLVGYRSGYNWSSDDSLTILQTQNTGGLTEAQRVAFFAKDGKVGVHTLAPTHDFEVVGTSAATDLQAVGSTNPGSLRLYEGSGGGSDNYTGFKAPGLVAAANPMYEMPADFPASDKVLQSNSSGVLTWVTPVPTTITVANEATDTTCFPLFVTAATGNLGPKTNAGFGFNSNTGAVTLSGGLGATNADFSAGVSVGTTLTVSASATIAGQAVPTISSTDELTNKTLNASVGKGTWTASGTWTLPAHTIGGAITYGGVTLSNAVTGSGSMVLSAGPTFTGTVGAAAITGTGVFTISTNGALSAPAVTGTGTWIQAGGSATTTKPYLLIEPSGTTSTGWSTVGTGIGVNADASFAGNLIDVQRAGTSRFSVAGSGVTTCQSQLTVNGNVVLGNAANQFQLTSDTALARLAAGLVGVPGFGSTPQALSGHGAVAATNLTTLTTTYANDGTANTTTTLAAGTSGQMKILAFVTDGGFDAVVTVTNAFWGGAGTLTFDTAGDICTLIYLNSKWMILDNNGVVSA